MIRDFTDADWDEQIKRQTAIFNHLYETAAPVPHASNKNRRRLRAHVILIAIAFLSGIIIAAGGICLYVIGSISQ